MSQPRHHKRHLYKFSLCETKLIVLIVPANRDANSSGQDCLSVGLIVYVTIRGIFGGRTKQNEKVASRVDARDRALVGAVFLGTFLLPLLYIFTPLLRFADYRIPAVVMWSGAIVMLFALWLFWRAHVDLGLNWSITLEMCKGHELVTNGIYRRVRHPMYTAIFLFAIAQGMLLSNWLAGWLGRACHLYGALPQQGPEGGEDDWRSVW